MKEENLYTSYELTLALMVIAEREGYRNHIARKVIDYSKAYLAQSDEGKKRLKRFESRLAKKILFFMAGILAKGVLHHLVLRKLYIESKARSFLKQYPEGQVVNIGAGLDTLLTRLADEGFNNTLIEIDYASVAQLKSSACSFESLQFIGADLSEKPLETVLKESAFKPEKPTLFLLEAVLMYLPQSTAFELLEKLPNISKAPAQIVFSVIDEGLKEFSGMRKNNSKFSWAISPSALNKKLAEKNLKVSEQVFPQGIQTELGEGLPTPKTLFDKEYFNLISV
jgi:O-methyltransferase involved in polyketide biosynthesis